uniref:RING-type E3 ubiquitin transferase n=1 Tax=Chrysemys picta bellii TaxID=8478 RepID=A0A8C3FB74_CHRPI
YNHATCPICLEYFKDPVIIDCGHNFCRACITQCWEGSDTAVSCPQCRETVQQGNLRPNRQLANVVEIVKRLSLQAAKGAGEERVCGEHQETLKLFCEEDQTSVCLVCHLSRAHRDHRVVPIEEAAQELISLKVACHRCDNKREMIAGEFNKLHTLLREEEQLLLQSLEEEERETLQRLQEKITKLSQQSSSLQQLITEIEEKCQQPVVELLKVRWHQNSPPIQNYTSDPWVWIPTMRVNVSVVTDKQNIWLRAPSVPIYCNKHQDLPDNPERFDTYTEVLGAEGFAGGRRYWEVEVGDKTGWALGVCRESVSRKGPITYTPGNGYWVVWLCDGEYEACTSPSTPLPVSVRPSRVGIFLDYEAGEVSFYNVTDRSHLFTFTDTFSGTLRPYFYPSGNNFLPL